MSTEALKTLLEKNTAFSESGFSLDLSHAHPEFDRCLRAFGHARGYALMAEYLCEAYRRRYGAPFLFTEKCVAWELKYHIDAFMAVQGYPGYHRHVSTRLYNRAALIAHCKEVDIDVHDVASIKQRLMFGYRRGLRPCWRGTEKDPFRK